MEEEKQIEMEISQVSVCEGGRPTKYIATGYEKVQKDERSELHKLFMCYADRFKYVACTCFVMSGTLVVIVGVASGYCVLQFNPAALFVILVAALILLGYVEALHYSNVSVERWNMAPYEASYPRACKVQKLVNTNEKVQRFLVGRQFFVIL